MANTIDSSLYLTNYQKQTRQTGTDALGKDDFLKILMAQLQNQDPLNPLDDKEFVAQMAQFSSLEQITNLGKSLEKLTEQQTQGQLIQYQQFVGKGVTWHNLDQDENGNTQIQEGQGVIKAVQYKENTARFILEDGTELGPESISEIHEAASETYMMQASGLIGKKVTWKNESGLEREATVTSVSFKNGKASFKLNDALESTIASNQIIKIST